MVIYLYLLILIVICVITGIITTIAEHRRLIPKKKRSAIRVIDAPKLVYQSIDSHISKEKENTMIVNQQSAYNFAHATVNAPGLNTTYSAVTASNTPVISQNSTGNLPNTFVNMPNQIQNSTTQITNNTQNDLNASIISTVPVITKSEPVSSAVTVNSGSSVEVLDIDPPKAGDLI